MSVARQEIANAVNLAFNIYLFIILVRVIFSWIRLRRPPAIVRQIERFAHAATEPLLRPIRNLLYRYQSGSPIDFSPVIAWLLILVVQRIVIRLISTV
ncbi:MAG: YggT family protein [Armatimonadota bacterium]|nr:YggT family protein [Armatimonadota bacterium]